MSPDKRERERERDPQTGRERERKLLISDDGFRKKKN